MKVVKFLVAALTAVVAGQASAKTFNGKSFVSIAGTIAEEKTKNGGNEGEHAVTIFNVSAAYGLGAGFGIGAKYFSYGRDEEFLDNDSLSISGYGPMLSFLHSSGVFINGAYLFSPEKKYKSGDGTTTFSDGYGYVADMGKIWEIGKGVGLGLQFSYSYTKYEKVKGGGASQNLSGEWSDSSLYPYLTFSLLF